MQGADIFTRRMIRGEIAKFFTNKSIWFSKKNNLFPNSVIPKNFFLYRVSLTFEDKHNQHLGIDFRKMKIIFSLNDISRFVKILMT